MPSSGSRHGLETRATGNRAVSTPRRVLCLAETQLSLCTSRLDGDRLAVGVERVPHFRRRVHRQIKSYATVIRIAGADKIAINSAAVKDPALIAKIAARFGSQAVVVAIDAWRASAGFEVFVAGGRTPTGRDAVQWAREAASHGAGEILLTSMDRDGTKSGFDCELTRLVATAVSIPVIASGGAGSAQHFIDVFQAGRADAALAASIFHFGLENIGELKRELQSAQVPVRWPC